MTLNAEWVVAAELDVWQPCRLQTGPYPGQGLGKPSPCPVHSHNSDSGPGG